jgi:hypothetical protein
VAFVTNSNGLYSELKDELQVAAEPLFEFACQQVQKRGEFLPVGVKLLANRHVELVAAAPEEDITTSEVVLPLLITALNESAVDAEAVGVCEWVKIEVQLGKLQDAVKVHVHHKRGLAVAFYIPAIKPFMRGWRFGEMIVTPAKALMLAWPTK